MKRIKKGIVVSNKPSKTLVVKIDTKVMHPLYKKSFMRSKKFYAHCEDNTKYNVGDVVFIEEHKPISKLKRWIVVENVEGIENV